MALTKHIPLSEDAALVTALAGTAMPVSHSAEDEAERWLRALRLHGEVGSVLQALGVGEAALETTGDHPAPTQTPPLGQPALERTVREAEEHAAAHNADAVGTADLLIALLDVYGDLIDHALEARGTSQGEVLERLAEHEGPGERVSR
jgi:hypothetical protein